MSRGFHDPMNEKGECLASRCTGGFNGGGWRPFREQWIITSLECGRGWRRLSCEHGRRSARWEGRTRNACCVVLAFMNFIIYIFIVTRRANVSLKIFGNCTERVRTNILEHYNIIHYSQHYSAEIFLSETAFGWKHSMEYGIQSLGNMSWCVLHLVHGLKSRDFISWI